MNSTNKSTYGRYTAVVRKYGAVIVSSAKSKFSSRSRVLGNVVLAIIRTLVLFSVYAYTYKYIGKSVQGVTYQIACYSMATYFFVLGFGMKFVFKFMEDDVRSGMVESYLTKPYDYVLFNVCRKLGTGIPDAFLTLLCLIPCLFIMVGLPPIHLSILWFVQFTTLVFLGLLLLSGIFGIIGVCSIWIENAFPLSNIVDKLIMILGGAYIPVALFPPFMKLITTYSPFGASMFATRVFYIDFQSQYAGLVGIQLFWITVSFVT